MLALHRFLSQDVNSIECLLNMCDEDGVHSRSHGIENRFITEQAAKMGIPILQPLSGRNNYEQNFKTAVLKLKEQGVVAGVFGDIYLKEHRDWIERVCADLEIEAVFPLWENDTTDLISEFVAEGFKTIVVAVNFEKLGKEWLGRIIDEQFVDDITKLDGIDPCAENGEYHSFVFDGPLFNQPITFEKGKIHQEEKHFYLEIK